VNAYKDFGPFDGKVWLNVASEGPLPHAAVGALKDVLEWKLQPFQMTVPRFLSVPHQLKTAIGSLINVDPQDVILGNSATYGLQILANGLPLKEGDQVILMQNDFPTNILPWLALTKKGVNVRQVKAREHVLTPDELVENLTPNTRVVCLSWVHTFSGHKIDVIRIGEICRERGIVFILNCSQAIGAFAVDASRIPADAIVCAGYKWMLGPYGTGFCWIKPEVRNTLNYNHAYWQSVLNEAQLVSTEEIVLPELKNARQYDVFGTANFFNYAPWTASIQYLTKLGMDKVEQYNQQLVGMIVDGIDPKQFKLISPAEPMFRSNLVVFSHLDPQQNEAVFNRLKDAGIFVALWKGNLRASAHIHNTRYDIEKFLRVVNRTSDPEQDRNAQRDEQDDSDDDDTLEPQNDQPGESQGDQQPREVQPQGEAQRPPQQQGQGRREGQREGHRGGRGRRHPRHRRDNRNPRRDQQRDPNRDPQKGPQQDQPREQQPANPPPVDQQPDQHPQSHDNKSE